MGKTLAGGSSLSPLVLFMACVLLQSACGGGAPLAPGGAGSAVHHGRKKASEDPSPGPSAGDVTCPALGEKVLPGPLPRAESAPVGTLPGAFSITSSGEATYSLPLVVPPGRAGMEPQLGIVYNSGSGEGTLGVGFAVSGLSAVTRCPHTIIDDGHARGVQDAPDDAFCLDGKRLVSVGTERNTVEYRTFPDTFSKVVAHLSSASSGALVGQVGVGVLAGAVAWFGEGTKMVYLNLITLGAYGGYRLWGGIYQAYREQGNSLLGALNGLNPLYQIGKGAVDTVTAVERGDYIGAGAAGITTVGVLGLTVVGGGVGGGGAVSKIGAVPQLGGAYSRVRATATQAELGGQVHHAPSWAATKAGGAPGVTRSNAPSIWMETADHQKTASHGYAGNRGASHRAAQEGLIRDGRYLDALKMDVDTIRGLFGDKYDGAIQQMGEYVWRANQ